MSFTSTLTNQTFTNNGAYAHKSTNSAVLDLFSNGVSSSNKSELFTNAYKEDPLLAIKTVLYLRDVRNGQGNRDIFRSFVDDMITNKKVKLLKKILPYIPEIGRWKDVIEVIGKHKKLDKTIFKMIAINLEAEDGLLAKWLPRQGAIAKQIAAYLELDHGTYRRKIVALSKTVEQQMCSNEWKEINYSHVPSIANKKYNAAFYRHDETRREAFLNKAIKGKAKINSSVLYPHDIVTMCRDDYSWANWNDNDTANALWAQLPNYMEEAVNVLPIIDTSGSMFTRAVGTSAQCINIATGLGLYFAEHNTGSYKNLWMNFSESPKAYMLEGNTLGEKLKNLDYRNWGMNTNIDKAMEFVLKAAKQNPEDAPKIIIIVSDMEFDGCVISDRTNFEHMRSEFKDAGVEMPTVIFWRVNVSSGSAPVLKDDKNAIVLNGYSPSVLKYILSGDVANYTPYKAMREVLDPMYNWLEELIVNK
jgi:hypothetical protein